MRKQSCRNIRPLVMLAILFAASLAGMAVQAQENNAILSSPDLDDSLLSGLIGRIVIARTSGGGEFRGSLFAVLPDRIELLDGEGRIIAVARALLASIETIDTSRDPAEYFQDSAANRLVIMPTGFGMETGEFHVAAQEIVIITASYGISPRFSVWGGVSIPGAVVNLRYSTPFGQKSALSLGTFAGLVWFDWPGAVLPYAIVSFGHPNRNLTLGTGVPFVWTQDRAIRPVGILGAIGVKIIVSASASVVTENWIMAYSDGWTWNSLDMYLFPSAVFRIAGARLSWDIGALVPLWLGYRDGSLMLEGMFGGTVIPIPILSITYRID